MSLLRSIAWHARLVLDVRSLGDALAVPKIVALNARRAIARVLIDYTPIGEAVVVELSVREHLRRARDLGCEVYCVFHQGDAASCPNDGVHGDELAGVPQRVLDEESWDVHGRGEKT